MRSSPSHRRRPAWRTAGLVLCAILLACGAAAPASAQQPAPAKAEELPAAGAGATLAGTTWRFTDENGAVFTATFEPNGTLSGTAVGSSWTWRQDGGNVVLRYANALGDSTRREGQLVAAGDLAGSGRSSRGATWTWTATRVR